jgi:PPK2 family polyphosphate:nucleotide phosphotransferase
MADPDRPLRRAMKSTRLLESLRVDDPDRFRLASVDPAGTAGLAKSDAEPMLDVDIERLRGVQERLYAEHRWAVLVVLQGMDTAGKDGVIKHVMAGLNPLGYDVHSFKAPNAEELDHDFLWRAALRLPRRGHIGIFNRSYYEETLVVRVHPEMLERQQLPKKLVGKDIWQERFDDICGFERHLVRSGVVVLKFFLHISKEEQRRRLLDRIEEPAKRWKFSLGDIAERALWPKYAAAYQAMIRATSRPHAPWHIVPADHKWFARLAVATAMVDALERLDPKFPKVEGAALKELAKVRRALVGEGREEMG